MNFCDLLRQHAIHQPDTAAIIDGQRTVSYCELNLLVRKTAAHLLDLGVAPEDRIGICLRDHADHLITTLAVARMGGVILPIDWRAKARERAALAGTFGAKLVLFDANRKAADVTANAVLDHDWHRAVARVDPQRDFLRDRQARSPEPDRESRP